MRKFEIASELQIFDTYILPPEFLKTVVNAEEVIRIAHERSQFIIQQAEAEKQNILAQNRMQAEEKLEEMREQMRQEFESAKAQVIAEMYGKMDEFLAKFRAAMPNMVESILFRIIGEFNSKELTARCIAMGIEEMREAIYMVIRVCPDEEADLKKLLHPWLKESQANGGYVRLETDHFVPEGQAVIITEIGSIELSIKQQILAFTNSLRQQFGMPKGIDDDA